MLIIIHAISNFNSLPEFEQNLKLCICIRWAATRPCGPNRQPNPKSQNKKTKPSPKATPLSL